MPKPENPTRALIFGISGQDGAYLSRLLLDDGYEVHGTSRSVKPRSYRNLETLGIRDRVTLHSAAPTEIRDVEKVIERSKPKEIYNLGGPSSVALSFRQPRETFESITLASLNILEAIRTNDTSIRYYSAASSECFGDTGNTPANEDTPFSPLSPYAEAKAVAFRRTVKYRDEFGLFASSGILFNHESPLRPEGFVTRKIIAGAARIAAAGTGTLQLGNLDIKRDWGWAPEYVDAMRRMLRDDQPDDYVIATEKSHSLRDFAAAAFAHFGLNWRDHVESDPALFRPTDIAMSAGDATKAHARLGWSAQTPMEGVVKLMAEAVMEGDSPPPRRHDRDLQGSQANRER